LLPRGNNEYRLQDYDHRRHELRELAENRHKGKQRISTDWQDAEPHIDDLPANCANGACSAYLHKEHIVFHI
jgi:hypothetical protein